MRERLEQTLEHITPVDRSLEEAGQAHLDNLTKPRGSLGRLEELALRLFCIQGAKGDPELRPLAPDPARVFTIAGDHGIAGPGGAGVSLFPQEVTRQMVLNFCAGGAAINVLCHSGGIGLTLVDAGCAGGEFPGHADLVQRKVARGTANMLEGPAMSEAECVRALELGIDLADEAAREGVRVVGTGDMGIGNTTASTALYCAFLGLEPLDITGPGTGLDAGAVERKAGTIARVLEKHAGVVGSGDAVDILAAVGGLEIAALAGLILGAARNRMAVVVDGFISTAAYVSARALCPLVEEYAFFSHFSAEPGHSVIMERLKARPLLDLGMRLGEGTGAALAIVLLRSAAYVFNEMATFAGAGVSTAGA